MRYFLLTFLLWGSAFAEDQQLQTSPVQALVLGGHKVQGSVVAPTPKPDIEGALPLEGHPLTAVVVTQCNLIVAVYMTMPDGKLVRFDKSAQINSDALMQMAYSATRSERVEVSCQGMGVEGVEKRDPI